MRRTLCVVFSCAALIACGEDDPPARTDTGAAATATATEAPGSDEVRAVAQRLLKAYWDADLNALCELGAPPNDAICGAAEKNGTAKPLKGDPPEIAEVRVQEDIAFAEAPGGISLTLVREKKTWLVDSSRGMPELRVTLPR